MVWFYYLFVTLSHLFAIEEQHEILDCKYIFGNLDQYLFGCAVSDDMVYQYITAPPVSKYFSDLVSSLREQFIHLDALVHAAKYVYFIMLINKF